MKKFWYGFLAFAPIPLFILYFYNFFTFFIHKIPEIENQTNEFPVEMFEHFGKLFIYIALAALISLIGLIIYILDIMKNKKFEGDKNNMKVVWVLIVLFLSSIGKIVYFFMEIMPRKADQDYYTPSVTERTN